MPPEKALLEIAKRPRRSAKNNDLQALSVVHAFSKVVAGSKYKVSFASSKSMLARFKAVDPAVMFDSLENSMPETSTAIVHPGTRQELLKDRSNRKKGGKNFDFFPNMLHHQIMWQRAIENPDLTRRAFTLWNIASHKFLPPAPRNNLLTARDVNILVSTFGGAIYSNRHFEFMLATLNEFSSTSTRTLTVNLAGLLTVAGDMSHHELMISGINRGGSKCDLQCSRVLYANCHSDDAAGKYNLDNNRFCRLYHEEDLRDLLRIFEYAKLYPSNFLTMQRQKFLRQNSNANILGSLVVTANLVFPGTKFLNSLHLGFSEEIGHFGKTGFFRVEPKEDLKITRELQRLRLDLECKPYKFDLGLSRMLQHSYEKRSFRAGLAADVPVSDFLHQKVALQNGTYADFFNHLNLFTQWMAVHSQKLHTPEAGYQWFIDLHNHTSHCVFKEDLNYDLVAMRVVMKNAEDEDELSSQLPQDFRSCVQFMSVMVNNLLSVIHGRSPSLMEPWKHRHLFPYLTDEILWWFEKTNLVFQHPSLPMFNQTFVDNNKRLAQVYWSIVRNEVKNLFLLFRNCQEITRQICRDIDKINFALALEKEGSFSEEVLKEYATSGSENDVEGKSREIAEKYANKAIRVFHDRDALAEVYGRTVVKNLDIEMCQLTQYDTYGMITKCEGQRAMRLGIPFSAVEVPMNYDDFTKIFAHSNAVPLINVVNPYLLMRIIVSRNRHQGHSLCKMLTDLFTYTTGPMNGDLIQNYIKNLKQEFVNKGNRKDFYKSLETSATGNAREINASVTRKEKKMCLVHKLVIGLNDTEALVEKSGVCPSSDDNITYLKLKWLASNQKDAIVNFEEHTPGTIKYAIDPGCKYSRAPHVKMDPMHDFNRGRIAPLTLGRMHHCAEYPDSRKHENFCEVSEWIGVGGSRGHSISTSLVNAYPHIQRTSLIGRYFSAAYNISRLHTFYKQRQRARDQENAVLVIQQTARIFLLRKRQALLLEQARQVENLKRNNAATKIQIEARKMLSRFREAESQYVFVNKDAAVAFHNKAMAKIIQTCWRSYHNRRITSASTEIQSAWRRMKNRLLFLEIRDKVVRCQSIVRRRLAINRRLEEEDYRRIQAEIERREEEEQKRYLEEQIEKEKRRKQEQEEAARRKVEHLKALQAQVRKFRDVRKNKQIREHRIQQPGEEQKLFPTEERSQYDMLLFHMKQWLELFFSYEHLSEQTRLHPYRDNRGLFPVTLVLRTTYAIYEMRKFRTKAHPVRVLLDACRMSRYVFCDGFAIGPRDLYLYNHRNSDGSFQLI
jgi:hypothetical protein